MRPSPPRRQRPTPRHAEPTPAADLPEVIIHAVDAASDQQLLDLVTDGVGAVVSAIGDLAP
jgi:hypothetical protein